MNYQITGAVAQVIIINDGKNTQNEATVKVDKD